MKVRRLLCGGICVALLAVTSSASAGGAWHNGITRKLGIWYSDGYHAQEGCPSETFGVRRHVGPDHYSAGGGFAGYKEHASPFADQHRPYGRPQGGEFFGGPFYDDAPSDGGHAEAAHPQPTPARPRAPVMPAVPNDPSTPMPHSHSEARLPSSMFPLAPIR